MIKIFLIFTFILCLICLGTCQSECEITLSQEKSFKLINCTYFASRSVFFVKIDLLTTEDGVVANYWNSKIVRKDSFIPLTVTN